MTDANGARPRARDIGIDIGIFRPGRWNAITDAPGVMVGHVTLVEGEGRLVPGRGPVRTGVTVILPHSGNLFGEKVRAAAYVLNGFGKSIGLHQVNELGNLETPIVLTNTLNAPIVADAVIEWSIKHSPEIGIGTGTINPVVGEVNDGILNDIQGRHVRKKHVFEAIANARSGAVQEGSVGAGTGSVCMGWKGGIGTSSRVLPPKRGGYTVGVLVQTNFGGVLTVNGAPVGRELGRYSNSADFPYETPEARDTEGADPEIGVPGISNPDGSVMVIVATDAPLDQRQLERLAKRAGLGLARTGFYSSNGSGDFFIAFSTAGRIPHDSPLTAKAEVMSNDAMSPLFLAVVEATEDAVINSMIKATTVVGRDGTMVDAIDIDQLLEVMRKYNALNWSRTLPPWGGGE
ncbi:MAG: P1 family peptidase [Bacillota bacterium]|jgi:D-aminopeptidase